MSLSYDNIKNYIKNANNYNELYKIWKIYPSTIRDNTENIHILILNTPCHGFGDVVFAMKLYKYLVSWYKCNVSIATTNVESFITLGINKDILYRLSTKNGDRKECRRFKNLNVSKLQGDDIFIFDLFFVAPLQSDFSIDRKDVMKLFPYATNFNTFFFSEYNDDTDKNFDFPVGIGGERLGLLFGQTPKNKVNDYKGIKYGVAYIAEGIDFSFECFLNYLALILKKYDKSIRIFVPSWITKAIIKNKFQIISLIKSKKTKERYNKLVVNRKDKFPRILLDNEGNNVLTFDSSVFPMPYEKMLNLYKYSIPDILVTGDQSITDVMGLNVRKEIWYQIAPWKEEFAKKLPKKKLRSIETSCGTINNQGKSVDFKKFTKKWDFRKLGRKEINRVVNMTLDLKQNLHIAIYREAVLEGRSLRKILEKYE